MTHLLAPANNSGVSIKLSSISIFGYGGYTRICLKSETPGIADWTIKTDNPLELYQQLYDITYQMARDLAITPGGVNEPYPAAPDPAVIRADIEPQKNDTAPNTPQPFSLIKMRDIKPDLPIKVKLALLIERFRDTLPDIAELLMQDYRAKTGRPYTQPAEIDTSQTNGNGSAPQKALITQLDADVQTITRHAEDLIVNNKLRHGAIAQTARLLGVPNAGAGFTRARAAATALLKRHAA